MSVMLSLLLSLPCPALSFVCFPLQLRRCKYCAVPVPWRPLPSPVTGTCDARLHSADVPCAQDKVPVVAGTSPPAHQYNASTPLFQGEPFFSSGTFTRDCRLGRPSSWGAPVTTTVDTPPSHSFILRLALRVLPSHRVLLPCVHVHAICWLAQSRTTARA